MNSDTNQDNSNKVDNNNPVIENNPELQDQNTSNNFIQHQMDPNINMNNLDLNYKVETTNQSEQNPIIYNEKTSFFSKLKEPLLILIISFVLNSPFVTTNVYKILPTVLKSSVNGIHLGLKYLGVFTQSLLIAVIYFLFKTFVLN